MLSISNIGLNQASSYYEKDDYYSRSSTDGDDWQGKLKNNYSFSDKFNPVEFNQALKSMPNPKRVGFDLTFSAPKSVSIAMVLNDNLKSEIINAHNKAVSETLKEIEDKEIETRITTNGVIERVKTGKMAAAKFNHFVSRNQDMQLHTHCVILNRTEYNGKSYAISNENLYDKHIIYGQLYRNRLAKNLQELGYKCHMTDVDKGFFELDDISQELIDNFSSRRLEIKDKLKTWDNFSAKAADRATQLTRKAKENKDLKILEKSWREDLQGVGLKKAEITLDKTIKSESLKRAVDNLSEHSFAFSAKELERVTLAEGCLSGLNRDDFQKMFQKALDKSEILCLGEIKTGNDTTTYYSTAENIELENSILENIKNESVLKALNDVDKNLNFLATKNNWTLSDEQYQAVLFVAKNTNQYNVIQGLAGTGKTYMLNATRELYEQQGYVVRGASFTGKAAEGLVNGAKIKSSTLHSFFNKLEKESGTNLNSNEIKNTWDFSGLKPGIKPELWVIDEAGLLDNNLFLTLQKAAKLKNAKVLLVGDNKQLLPVGAGNAYSNLVQKKAISTVFLSEIKRQENTEILQAVKEAVNGDVSKSLDILSKNITELKTAPARFKAITKEFCSLDMFERNKTIVLTAKNSDRNKLNELIRGELIKRREILEENQVDIEVLGRDSKKIVKKFAPQDKIIFTKNDYKLGVMNGQTGTIFAGISKNKCLKVLLENGKIILVDTNVYKNLDYGYCITSYKAQGVTAERAIINVDSAQKSLNTRNSYYVNISRAKKGVSIYTDNQAKIKEQFALWAKKITSEDFKISKKVPKISIPKIPIPVIGQGLSLGLKAANLSLKLITKTTNLALKSATFSDKKNDKLKNNSGFHI